jgi:hypothetical protein
VSFLAVIYGIGGGIRIKCVNTIQLLASKKKKALYALQTNIDALCKKYGLNKIGFLTLTFADDLQCHKEATKRFNSLATNILKNKYSAWIRISERQKSGRWHFHLIVVCKNDIRRGLRFDELKNRNYKSANKALRGEWSFWRNVAKKYNFGRTELLPIRKSGEAVAAYMAKYLTKGERTADDKGARLVSYSSKVLRVCTQRFSWCGGGAKKWRQACDIFFMLYKMPVIKHWAYKYGEQIKKIALLL